MPSQHCNERATACDGGERGGAGGEGFPHLHKHDEDSLLPSHDGIFCVVGLRRSHLHGQQRQEHPSVGRRRQRALVRARRPCKRRRVPHARSCHQRPRFWWRRREYSPQAQTLPSPGDGSILRKLKHSLPRRTFRPRQEPLDRSWLHPLRFTWQRLQRDVWDVAILKCLRTLAGHTHHVSTLAKVPGNLVASGIWDGSIRVWNPATGQCVRTIENVHGDDTGVWCVAWVPGLDLLASSGGDYLMVGRRDRRDQGHLHWRI
jgi:WD40 repeat protein